MITVIIHLDVGMCFHCCVGMVADPAIICGEERGKPRSFLIRRFRYRCCNVGAASNPD